MLIKTSLLFKIKCLKDFDALTCWPFIFIRPEQVENKGLIEHELVHYREQRKMFLLPWLVLYLVSKKFRLAAELRAYQRQIEVGGISIRQAAFYLRKYNLGISYADAIKKLKQK